MTERDTYKWVGRILWYAPTLFVCWYCGLYSFNPWSPNWKLWGAYVAVSITECLGSWIRGYVKCAEKHGITQNL